MNGLRPIAALPQEARPGRVDYSSVGSIIGLVVMTVGIAMLVPAAVDMRAGNPDWQVFVVAGFVTILMGGLSWLATRKAAARLEVREAFLLTTLTWIILAAFGCLPFYFSSLKLSFADAYFEAMSGMTTTGSTTIVGLDGAPPGILLWRAILQWIGGVGIIVIALAVMPGLRVGGMQLLQTESSDRSEKILPRVSAMAGSIVAIYCTLTFACLVAYWLAGMTPFEALAHALTTLATGGFSTSDSSIGHFQSHAIEWISTAFMFAASLPFLAYMRYLRGGLRALGEDPQIRLFAILAGAAAAVQAIYLIVSGTMGEADAVRLSLFNTATILSTTGYAAADYSVWGPFYNAVIFLLMFIGGCAGSSAGGLKILRLGIIIAVLRQHLSRIIRPHGIFPVRFGSRRVHDDVAVAVSGFLFLYLAAFAVVALALDMTGLDGITSLSAAITTLANVGPGLGPTIGPAGTFQSFTDLQKWICSGAMLLGRLELLTVLVLFIPRFWR
ncbi:MAG: TrkH family potassium uptake protein [Flavobacteriaceae bacterium]